MGSTAMADISNSTTFLVLVTAFVICLNSFVIAELNYRLNSNVLPEAYNITIKPYLLADDGEKQFTFEGSATIIIHATIDDVTEITLHKDYIDISSVQIYDAENTMFEHINPKTLIYEDVTDKLTVPLAQALNVNNTYYLHFEYTGQVRSGTAGFFRASYTTPEGEIRWIGLTQLQRIDARTVFPCFDEPAMKAQFTMHISRPSHYNSLFNTEKLNSEPDGIDRYWDHFTETPLMSTYLVAFIVSDFATRGDKDFTLSTRPDYLNKTDFSYSVGRKVLDAYDTYTKLPYKQLGNPIMQKAGSPTFPHNGMENWGLVIYRDSVLVHEPGYSDGWSDKEYTITILTHETAHMWFGNSVTFAWWSYFWLNEAFARYYQYYLAHELYPEYQLDLQFVVNQVHLIFGTDAVNTTQPMTSPESSVQSPSEVAKKFSGIAYAKGAAILRMIRNIMGANNFDNAVHDYLQENQLKSVVPEQLFIHLKRYWPVEQQVDLDQFFYDWTEQVGFPILAVTLSSDRKTVTIHQTRFLLKSNDGSDPTLRYTLPITYTTDSERNFEKLTPEFYFDKNDQQVTWQLPEAAKWVIFNLQQSNYYRVFYDVESWKNIKWALTQSNHSGIHVANRAQLIDDLFNYARNTLLDYDEVFQFMEYLETETDYLPWYAAFTGMQRVAQRLTVQQSKNFAVFIDDVTQKVYDKLGFSSDEDTVLDVYNRNKIISWRCRYGLNDCNHDARAQFDSSVETNTKPSVDFRETLYCSAVRFGVSSYYNTLERQFETENVTSEQELLLRAMACTYHFVEYHYARILSNLIPQELKITALTPMYTKNPDNVTPVFQLIVSSVDSLAEALGSWSSVANVISDISNYFTTKDQRQMLDEFIAEQGELFGSSEAVLHTALETVDENLEWAERRLGPLIVYLDSRNEAGTLTIFFTLASSVLLALFVRVLS